MSKFNMSVSKRMPEENVGSSDGFPLKEGKGRFKHFLAIEVDCPPGLSIVPLTTYVDCKPARLVILPECAKFFDIYDIQIGSVCIQWNSGKISAECFPPLPNVEESMMIEEFLLINCPGMYPGMRLNMKVHNNSSRSRILRGLWWVNCVDMVRP